MVCIDFYSTEITHRRFQYSIYLPYFSFLGRLYKMDGMSTAGIVCIVKGTVPKL